MLADGGLGPQARDERKGLVLAAASLLSTNPCTCVRYKHVVYHVRACCGASQFCGDTVCDLFMTLAKGLTHPQARRWAH